MAFQIDPKTGRQVRGFAALDKEARTKVASKGGASVSPYNRSFSKDRALATEAGRKGGEISRGGGKRKAVTPSPVDNSKGGVATKEPT